MSYVKITDFATKDALLSGNPAKLVKGVEIDDEYNAIQVADALNVKGPATATDNALARFDGTTGKLVQDSTLVVSDAGVVTGITVAASLVTNTPAGSIAATDVQAALNELDTEKSAIPTTVTKDSSTGAAQLPVGTQAQRPTGAAGLIRFNDDLDKFEGHNGTTWSSVGSNQFDEVVIDSSGGGSITIEPPVTAGDYTLTLPAETGAAALASQTGAFKNKITNGGFAINQRAYVSGAAVGAGLYGHDRWKMAASGDTYTYSTTNNKTTVTIPAGKVLQQVIEGLNLQTGTYCLSWEGTAQGKIGAGSYGASGITGSITGGTNTTIEFGPGTVANVQLEAGSVATPFENRPYGVELSLCQRYYEAQHLSAYINYVPGGIVDVLFGAWAVDKRTVPTCTLSNQTQLDTASATSNTPNRTFRIGKVSGGSIGSVGATITGSAEL